MATPSIQTLITQAQQVLNLQSSNEIRATLAAVLANANVGTPLNPNLTTQQLWNEFGEIVRQSTDDIMSIITDQMMRMVFSPPAPGGAGADKQVIFNDMGVLAGDAGLTYNKATDALTITGDLTVDTSTLKVDATNDRVGIGTASPAQFVHLSKSSTSTALTAPPVGGASLRIQNTSSTNNNFGSIEFYNANGLFGGSVNCQFTNQATPTNDLVFVTRGSSGGLEHYRIAADGVCTWSEVGGVAGTAMTLNSTGLGVGVTPTGTGGCLQLKSGITFPATQVASSDANTLDDYEEGTFTPTIIGTSTAGVGVYTVQLAKYTKVGRLVTVEVDLGWSAHTGTGNMQITGLPFTTNATVFTSVTLGYVDNIALTAGNIMTAYTSTSSTLINLIQTPTGGGATTGVPIDVAGRIMGSVTYSV